MPRAVPPPLAVRWPLACVAAPGLGRPGRPAEAPAGRPAPAVRCWARRRPCALGALWPLRLASVCWRLRSVCAPPFGRRSCGARRLSAPCVVAGRLVVRPGSGSAAPCRVFGRGAPPGRSAARWRGSARPPPLVAPWPVGSARSPSRRLRRVSAGPGLAGSAARCWRGPPRRGEGVLMVARRPVAPVRGEGCERPEPRPAPPRPRQAQKEARLSAGLFARQV